MSVQSEITRIQTARNLLRTKGVALGIASSTDTLTDLATKYNGITDRGIPNAEVQEGQSYTIQPGYYHGGTIQGVSGGGNYALQSKTVTPTKTEQTITKDAGYYGLSSVTINPIPDAYQDVTDVTATASDVLSGKVFVDSDGSVIAGTMYNRGSVSNTIQAGGSYTIPEGYHDGTGKVTAATLASQTGVDTGKTKVTADGMLTGMQAWVDGSKVTGTMPNKGSITGSITGLGSVTGDTSYVIPEGYHDGTGTISITNDIETALAAI